MACNTREAVIEKKHEVSIGGPHSILPSVHQIVMQTIPHTTTTELAPQVDNAMKYTVPLCTIFSIKYLNTLLIIQPTSSRRKQIRGRSAEPSGELWTLLFRLSWIARVKQLR